MISASIVLDSVSEQQHRLTTFELRYPKFIHGELMTHRVFSRNASSSRAIPTEKYLEEVRSDGLRAEPAAWGKNQKGMQAKELLNEKDATEAKRLWSAAALAAAADAERMHKLGAHKQIVNRILEPYVHINVVVTATEYQNFFGLRLHKDADPTMKALADTMWEAYLASNPVRRQPGNWHLPYVSTVERNAIGIDQAIKISVARCARISYKSFLTGKASSLEEDLALYERLLGAQPIHASPAEHQATPSDDRRLWGNFTGFAQYRKMLAGENIAPLPGGYR